MREEARDWYDGALHDLQQAESSLKEGRYDWALFAAQQASEKCLKAALMMLKHKRPPKSRDLVELARLVGLELGEELETALAELTPYYVVARYPNAGLRRPWESISRRTAERLLNAARALVERVGTVLELA